MKSISVEEARAIDRDAVERLGMPSILLMENASRALADAAAAMGDSYVIYCGPGNNGGDGLAAARHLASRYGACPARVFLIREPDPERCPDAALQLRILRNAGHPVAVGELPPLASPEDVVIDAMFGTGLTRGIEGAAATWVERFNESPGRKLCVDIPSGLHGDRGVPLGPTCRGETTVTFAAAKHGLLVPAAREYVGKIVVADLGLPG